MKKILNLLAVGLTIAGICLQANNITGGDFLLVLSAATLLTSLIVFTIKDNKDAGLSNWLNYLLVGIAALFIAGATMKFQHWPGGALVSLIAFVLLPISIIALIFQKEEVKISKQFFITSGLFFMFLLGTTAHGLFDCGQCGKDQCSTEQVKEDCCKKGADKSQCKMGDASKACCKKGTTGEGKCKEMGTCKMGDASKACCKKGTAEEGKCKEGAAKKDCCKEKKKAACKH